MVPNSRGSWVVAFPHFEPVSGQSFCPRFDSASVERQNEVTVDDNSSVLGLPDFCKRDLVVRPECR